uniref:50S ribosomal protein L34 n=1 Tax=Rhizophora mucronata TaxID=61149 RepID=A0A2P2JNL1_RHIMU
MLLFPKRTFQPSLIKRKRNHGFFARYCPVSALGLFLE